MSRAGAGEGMRVAAVILAAGGSRRLGEPKQLLRLGGETLLDRAVRVAREAGCAPVLVVLGAEAEPIAARCALLGAVAVRHAGWESGMGTTIAAGVGELEDAGWAGEGMVLMVCDQPAVTAEHLRALMGGGAEVTASGYAGRRGVPAYFPVVKAAELRELTGDAGARELLREARVVELEGGELDVDTAGEWAEVRGRFG